MLAVIGSAALAIQGLELGRTMSDIDLVGTYPELLEYLKSKGVTQIQPIELGAKIVGKSDVIYECEIAWPGSTAQELLTYISNDPETFYANGLMYASLDVCYALKMSHRFKKNSVHFHKTRDDIKKMRSWNAIIPFDFKEIYKRRKQEALNYSHPKLNQSKKDFFTDDVPYIYDHDSIHETVKLFGKPAYSYFKPDEAEVLTSKSMFYDLPEEVRLAAVYEESCVLALERSQIPYPKTERRKSFEMALTKVCTSITSGWFRTYAWENYDKVIHMYNTAILQGYGYVESFQYGLEKGVVKPHKR